MWFIFFFVSFRFIHEWILHNIYNQYLLVIIPNENETKWNKTVITTTTTKKMRRKNLKTSEKEKRSSVNISSGNWSATKYTFTLIRNVFSWKTIAILFNVLCKQKHSLLHRLLNFKLAFKTDFSFRFSFLEFPHQ